MILWSYTIFVYLDILLLLLGHSHTFVSDLISLHYEDLNTCAEQHHLPEN